MKRREFLKTSAVAAGLVGSLTIEPMLAVAESDPLTPPEQPGAPLKDNRPAEYLHRVQGDSFLPKPPAPARSYPITPMPLVERVGRKIVPRRGFCSIAPGESVSGSLISGNGAMSIELMGDPYAEQILFHHESLLMPWKKPLEAPKVADIFPQVRQMVLAGKDREAMTLALQHMNDSPIFWTPIRRNGCFAAREINRTFRWISWQRKFRSVTNATGSARNRLWCRLRMPCISIRPASPRNRWKRKS